MKNHSFHKHIDSPLSATQIKIDKLSIIKVQSYFIKIRISNKIAKKLPFGYQTESGVVNLF
jgi:hypothetical protein